MALKEQIVPIPLGGSPEEGGGLREGVDSKLVNAPYLLDLQNGELGKDGSVRRRRPADPMSASGLSERALQNLNSVMVHEGRTLVVNTASGPYTFSEDSGWASSGEFGQQPCEVQTKQVASCSNYYADSAVSGDNIAFVFLEDDGLYFAAYNQDTNAVVCPKTRIVSGTLYNPKIFALPTSGKFNVFYMSAESNATLTLLQINATAFPGTGSPLGTTYTNVDQYDWADGPSNTWYLATANNGGPNTVTVRQVNDTTLVTAGSQTVATIGGSNGIGCWYNGLAGQLYVAAFDSSVDATHVQTARFPLALGSQTIGPDFTLAPSLYSGVSYDCMVPTFAYSGDNTSDMLITISIISRRSALNTLVSPEFGTYVHEGPFGQHGSVQGFIVNSSLSTLSTVTTLWNYYAATKAWNPMASSAQRPMVGLLRLNTAGYEFYLTGAPTAYGWENYVESLQPSILICSIGQLPTADYDGHLYNFSVAGVCHNDVAVRPDVTPVYTQSGSMGPYTATSTHYFSRVSHVSQGTGDVAVFSRPVYAKYDPKAACEPQIPIYSSGTLYDKTLYGIQGIYGYIHTTSFDYKCTPRRSAEASGLTLNAAGYLGAFDGTGTYELAPYAFAEINDDAGVSIEPVNGITSVTGGASPVFRLTSPTPTLESDERGCVNQIQFVYSWEDAAGNLHRSSPSAPYYTIGVDYDTSATAGASFKPRDYTVNAYITDLPPTAIQAVKDNRFIEVYISGNFFSGVQVQDGNYITTSPQTIGPDEVDASMHLAYRVKYDPGSQRDTERPWLLKLALSFTESTDGVSPYSDNELLYTDGGGFESHAPPAMIDIMATNDRVWGITNNEVWPSKALEPGIAPEFNGNLVIPMLTGSGPCVAIAALDEKVIVFKASSIFVITGDGPNNTGGGNAFPVPQAVSTDIGCVSRASVVRGPFGLAFQSARGLYLLDRGLNLTWIGKSVEDTVGTDPVVCGVVVPEQSHVRWVLDATGKAVVWNYDMNQWGIYGGSKEVHGVPYQGAWVGLLDGLVLPDTTTAYFAQEFVPTTNDSGNYVQYPMPLTFTTAWVKPGSIQGFVRCRRALLLGEVGTIPGFFNAHNGLQIEAQYNYDPTTLTTYSWTPDETHVTWPNFECHLQYQRFESIRFVVSEVPIDGQLTCPGVAFSGMTLRVAVKGVPFKYFRQGDVR